MIVILHKTPVGRDAPGAPQTALNYCVRRARGVAPYIFRAIFVHFVCSCVCRGFCRVRCPHRTDKYCHACGVMRTSTLQRLLNPFIAKIRR